MGTNADELRIEIEATRDDMGQTLDAIGDKVVPSRIVERRKQRLMDRTRRFRDRMMGSAHAASESVSGGVTNAAETVRELPETVKERTEGAPMVAGALAFGTGMLVAAMIPPTRMEREKSRMVRDAVEPIKQEVASEAREMAEHLKEPAKEAAQHVGQQVGAGAHDLADEARGSAAMGRPAGGQPQV